MGYQVNRVEWHPEGFAVQDGEETVVFELCADAVRFADLVNARDTAGAEVLAFPVFERMRDACVRMREKARPPLPLRGADGPGQQTPSGGDVTGAPG